MKTADQLIEINVETIERSSPSKIEVRLIDPLEGSNWDDLVLSHPGHTPFHSAAWARVLARAYGHRPRYLFFSRAGEPAALVPLMEVDSRITGRRGVSLPFSDFCDPLVFDSVEAGAVWDGISELAHEQGWKHFEVRGGRRVLPNVSASKAFYGHTLSLSKDSESNLATFSSAVRRAIRKAQRSNLVVRIGQTEDLVREFYRIHVRTRQRHGIPPQPWSFFLSIHREAIETEHGFVVLVASGAKPIAAAVFLHFGKNAVYKFGGSDPGYQEVRGNNLLMWEAIQHLAQRGCRSLHFGRTDMDDAGLRRFKAGWGTKEETLEYFTFDLKSRAWSDGQSRAGVAFSSKFFRRLPVIVNRAAGAMVYPHLD